MCVKKKKNENWQILFKSDSMFKISKNFISLLVLLPSLMSITIFLIAFYVINDWSSVSDEKTTFNYKSEEILFIIS